MTQRKVIAAWSSTVPHRVLDDGSEWIFDGPDGKWSRFTPPLPPEALGEVAAFEVGDKVTVDGHEDVARVRQVMVDVEWPDCNGRGIFDPEQLTKVPR